MPSWNRCRLLAGVLGLLAAFGEGAWLTAEEKAPSATEEKDFHPDGSVRIIRHVRRDSAGGKQLHGAWQWWDMAGRLVADGEFVNGRREGRWQRLHTLEDTPALRDAASSGFEPPFLSEASFRNGDLDGVWKTTDARGRVASVLRYVAGEREGLAEWWFASGRKSQHAEYRAGRLHGELIRWNVGGEELFRRGFDEAREIVMQTAAYPGGQRRQSITLLAAPLLLDRRDDWWTATRAEHRSQGHDERHGMTALWHANGQIARHGAFEHDLPVGTHTWWFAQGQKAVSGDFVDGHAEGEWIWWRPSGQERIRGKFACGLPVGDWRWTRVDGSTVTAASEQVVAASEGRRTGKGETASQSTVPTRPLAPVSSTSNLHHAALDSHAALLALFGTQWPRRDAPPTPPAMLATAQAARVEVRR